MDSLIFELQVVIYFQLFLSANVRHSRLLRSEALVYNGYIFFRTTVLRYKNCNFSRVIAYSLRWHRNHYIQLTIKAIKKMAELTMLVLALLDRYSGCFLLSYSRNVRNLKTVVSIFTLIWCKNQLVLD